jgi:oligopeptide/dipeptide ABC transporter ATP-binding protein
MTASAPLLSVRDLHAGFRTDAGMVRAVDGVSLDVAHGEAVGIVGESGSGKSAFAFALQRLLPPAGIISQGEALFAGRDLLKMPQSELLTIRGRRIGMVFQDPMTSLNPYMRVGAQIGEPLRRHLGLNATAARARAIGLLDQVGIPEPATRVDRYPHELSGGQRQRVLIAMALSCDPELLIADEPTTALDVTIQAQILDLIREQQRRRRMALLLITHNLGVVAGMCDRVAVMYAGRIVEMAETARLFASPAHPYTRCLLASVPRLDDDRTRPLYAIPGAPPALLDRSPGCAFASRCPHATEPCRADDPPMRTDSFARQHRCLLDLPPEARK